MELKPNMCGNAKRISVCGGQFTRQWLCSCISLLQPSVAVYVCGIAERLQEVGDEEGAVGIQPIGPSVRYQSWSNSKFFSLSNVVLNSFGINFVCSKHFLRFLQTVKFGVTLLVKDVGEKQKLAFTFRQTRAMTKAKWNLARKDMVINYITEETMLVDKETKRPWRGPREKDARFLQFFIEGCSDEDDVVLDYTTAIGLLKFSYHTFQMLPLS